MLFQRGGGVNLGDTVTYKSRFSGKAREGTVEAIIINANGTKSYIIKRLDVAGTIKKTPVPSKSLMGVRKENVELKPPVADPVDLSLLKIGLVDSDALKAVFQKLPEVKLKIIDGTLYFSGNLDGLETALAGIKTLTQRVFSVKEGDGRFFLLYHVPVLVKESMLNHVNVKSYFQDIHGSRANFFAHKLGVMGNDVLDVGSRTGHFCNEAKSRGAKFVLGVDLDREAVEEARKSFCESDKLRFTSDPLEVLSKSEKHKSCYDLVTIFLCDGQLCNDRDAAKAIVGLLRPGGRVVITSEFMPDGQEAPMANRFASLFPFRYSRELINTGGENFVLYTLFKPLVVD